MDTGEKQNANPTVLAVEKQTHRLALDYPELRAISMPSAGYDEEGMDFADHIERTPEDRAIMQALSDSNTSTDGKVTSLLRNIGINVAGKGVQPCTRPPRFWTGYNNSTSSAASPAPQQPPPNASKGVDVNEVFDIIRNIQDPEHPLTLEQLGVVSRQQIEVSPNRVHVRFTPTIPHCSMATHIGLCLKVKLDRSLPRRIQKFVSIQPGTHVSENAIGKQLADKERVCAALENKHLLGIVNKCILGGMTGNMT